MSTVTLEWTDPTARDDASHTPLVPSEIAEIRIFDAVNGAAAVQIGTAEGPATTYTTGQLVGGNHVFTVEAVDTAGDVSQMSAPFMVQIPLAPPLPPTGLTGTVNP